MLTEIEYVARVYLLSVLLVLLVRLCLAWWFFEKEGVETSIYDEVIKSSRWPVEVYRWLRDL